MSYDYEYSSESEAYDEVEMKLNPDDIPAWTSLFMICLWVFGLIMSIACLVIGSLNIYFAISEECDDVKITIWLFGEGVIMILTAFISLFNYESNKNRKITDSSDIYDSIELLVAIGWLITGTVFIYTTEQTCSDFLLDYMEGLIIALWCLYGISLLVGCCVGSALCCYLLDDEED